MSDRTQITVFGIPLDEVQDLVDRVKEQEATIDGLSQQNTDLEREIEKHKARYDGAMKLLESKEQGLAYLKQQYAGLAESTKKISSSYLKLHKAVESLAEAIGNLADVPVSDLDASIESLQAEAYKALE